MLCLLILIAISDCVLKTNLSGESPTLLGCGSTTNDSVLTIKVLGHLFQGGVLGLNEEEVDDGKLETEPDTVEDVVLPAEVVKGNWVDILVEED